MINSLFNMSCEFRDRITNPQCHILKALPVAKAAIGYEGESVLKVKAELCDSLDQSRETSCPVFKSLKELKIKSDFAIPTIFRV